MFSFCILFTLIENYMQILGIPNGIFLSLSTCTMHQHWPIDFTEEGADYSFLCVNFLFAC